MDTNLTKLKELFWTGEPDNIDLALSIAQTNQINLSIFRQNLAYIFEDGDTHPSYRDKIMSLEEMLKLAPRIWGLSMDGEKMPVFLEELYCFRYVLILELHNNHLRLLPDRISQFTQLKSLSIQDNPIEELPDLSNLEKLHTLNLKGNQLKSLPLSLLQLKNLKILNLENNPNLDFESDTELIFLLEQIRKLPKLKKLLL
ncbi:MAG: hypothetical protein MK212_12040 [Saprospiraceae bacterium]|nr:hypothetical protein [Saprospiraceae bacterium]